MGCAVLDSDSGGNTELSRIRGIGAMRCAAAAQGVFGWLWRAIGIAAKATITRKAKKAASQPRRTLSKRSPFRKRSCVLCFAPNQVGMPGQPTLLVHGQNGERLHRQ